MKVLGIVGSPRKGGNTEILMEEALLAASELGASTEIILLHDKSITPCDGCDACVKTGECRIQDDMQPIFRDMIKADGIILGSPVYMGGVTAQVKALIDRTYSFIGGRKLDGKVAAPLLALRKVGAGQTQSQMYSYFNHQGMIPLAGGIGYGRKKGDVRTGTGGGYNITAIDEARKTGIAIVEMLKRIGVK